jgi:hypothetical protein
MEHQPPNDGAGSLISAPPISEFSLETARTAWVQLNERSRWYSSQLWQAPIAYIATVLVMVGWTVDKGLAGQWAFLALLGAGLGGACITFHLMLVHERVNEIVADMKRLEIWLGIKAVLGHELSKSDVGGSRIASPLVWLLGIFSALCIFASGFLFDYSVCVAL